MCPTRVDDSLELRFVKSSQTLMEPSLEAVTNFDPSRLNSIAEIEALWAAVWVFSNLPVQAS